MSKTQSEVHGAITCPFCLSSAEVRQTPGKNFKFIFCETSCKRIQTSVPGQAKAYQDYIDDNMRPIIENPAQVIDEQPIVAPVTLETLEPANDENAAPEKAAGGFWPWEE